MNDDRSTRVFSPAAVDADDIGRLWSRFAERVPLAPGATLGKGGAGIVYRAHDASLRRDVALKVLHAETPDAARRFLAEAQILAQLAHPYIAPVYRIGVDDAGRPCFAMKLIEGETLRDKLASFHGTVGARVRYALPIIVKICDAVAYAHSRGVIHCDLKPENVMIGAFGEVTLMDWGIARTLPRPGAITVESAPVARAGTLEYMAPEQALDADFVDELADVFGLGAVLHYALFAKPPREAEDVTGLLADIALPDVDTVAFPRSLLHLCARALDRDRTKRPKSAEALRDELEVTLEERGDVDVREVAPGMVVIREGEVAREAFVIVRGSCEAWHLVDGKRVVLRTMTPGDVFGEAAVFDGGTRTASVSAVDDVELIVVDADEIRGRVGARSFVTTLAKRFRELETRATAAEARLKLRP